MRSEWEQLSGQWERQLKGRNAAPRTRQAYLASLAKLASWASGEEGLDSPLVITTTNLEQFFADEFDSTTRFGRPPTADTMAMHHRHLKVFFGWLAKLEDAPNPMRDVVAPKVPEKLPPVLADDALRALLATCQGKDFNSRRDLAILRILLDTGIRRAELHGISIEDVDDAQQLIRVLGKGRKERIVPYGGRTADALESYLRARGKHPDRKRPELWLASSPRRGALGYDGIAQMLERRGKLAGVDGVHAHIFRHTACTSQLDAGMSEGDVMRLFGWTTPAMVRHYGASVAHQRAIKAARRTSHADRI